MNRTARYARLERLTGVGRKGLVKISRTEVALVGCGTLGGAYAQNLVRMGIGRLHLIDRDFVEDHNLSTQVLFTEEDARQVLPKVIAAQQHLQTINSDCQIEAHCLDLNAVNAEDLLKKVTFILDATDNFETRLLINDLTVKFNLPWIYTALVGFRGLVMAIHSPQTACLRCFVDEPPEAGALPTCETAGVWLPVAQSLVGIGLTEMLRHLSGEPFSATLHELDFETYQWRQITISRRKDCPTCCQRDFQFLTGQSGAQATKLCGRDMVHLTPDHPVQLNLSEIAAHLATNFQIQQTEYLLHLKASVAEIYLFPDGRAFVKGVSDVAQARAIYNRYLGG